MNMSCDWSDKLHTELWFVNTCVDEVVKGEEANALIGHVDEPFDAQGVQGGDDVKSDSHRHEHGQQHSVHNIPRVQDIW